MSSAGDNDWKWSNEHRDYYRYTWNTDGSWGRVEWGRSRLPDPDIPPTSQPPPASQQSQAHGYRSSVPTSTTHTQYPHYQPQAPIPAQPVQSQPQQYQTPTYQQPTHHAQTLQQQASYPPGQERANPYPPSTPSNTSNSTYLDSSPLSARSGSTQESAYSPPNPNIYSQDPRWQRRAGQ